MIKITPLSGNEIRLETENGEVYRIRDSEELGLWISMEPMGEMTVQDWREKGRESFSTNGIRLNCREGI